MIKKLKNLFINISSLKFAFIIGLLNLVLFNIPLLKIVIDYQGLSIPRKTLIFSSLLFLIPIANALIVYILSLISRHLAKILWIIFFLINAVVIYFIKTYNIILDEDMIGNVMNTNKNEVISFFSAGFVLYFVFLGILPSLFIVFSKPVKDKFKKAISSIGIMLSTMLLIVIINIGNLPWVHLNSWLVGSYVMPWSYVINTQRYFHHKHKEAKEAILLPDASIKDSTKAVVVLIIGESARKDNFSLYGYKRNTNPLLSKIEHLHHYNAESAATYTIAGIKAMLEHTPSKKSYECLTSYLHRNGATVVWRTTNSGEPKMTVDKYQTADSLKALFPDADKNHDGILLQGLKDEIMNSKNDKTLIVLHTGTSHGPDYYKKYPGEFEIFKPVCKNVELEKCSIDELVNAYDNTIVYTDYLIYNTIEELRQLPAEYKSTMMFVSDHGESLGENGIYMHGITKKLAPVQQYEIPFLVWVSDNRLKLKENNLLTQHNVFHSVLHFLSVDSPIYNKELDLFK